MTRLPLARHLLRARDLIDSGYAEPLDLERLALTAHVSPRHFGRSFKRAFGETPHQYLLTRRIERARHLLRTTEMKVADVCLAVGFSSVGSFSDTFRRHVGVSPGRYRGAASPVPSEADRIPSCAVMAWGRLPRNGAFGEDSRAAAD